MRDFWSFLLQTLTASGAAALLLVVKAMFRDKLSPRWQSAVWGVLGLALLVPAGLGGRYILFNWPWLVETVRSALTGEYGALARVTVPVPLPPPAAPRTAADWLYLVYAAGVLFFLGRYLVSYVRLRRALRRGSPADSAPIRAAAGKYGLPVCPAVEVEGLPSAFICGVVRPVLALPAGEAPDEKVLLHELLHLKYHDAAWGLLICFFRCLHWCNPLLWHCADLAGNDLESLCDQRVLERLEGEDRRDYGRILLRMANERYARAPGTSSMANGGKNIRRRVEAIARFKRYPAGMALVSVCVALVMAPPLLLGSHAQAVRPGRGGSAVGTAAAMASARTTWCTTYAGALDAYAKAVLTQDILYRAMCAPLEDQADLAAQLRRGGEPRWDCGLAEEPYVHGGYQICDLVPAGEDVHEGLLAVELTDAPEGEAWDGTVQSRWRAVQALRAEKEGGRWVVRPLEDIRTVQGDARSFGDLGLPSFLYEAQSGEFTLRMQFQTSSCIDSYVQHDGLTAFSSRSFLTTPQPGGSFTSAKYSTHLTAVYHGDPGKPGIRSVGASCAPMSFGGERPDLRDPGAEGSAGSSSGGEDWATASGFNWKRDGNEIFLSGGGSGFYGEGAEPYLPPDCYALDFYINGVKEAELTLLPVEGGGPHG